ncbi:hypothetical protein ACWCOP_03030 [Maricaulaceae bacterium MS644]
MKHLLAAAALAPLLIACASVEARELAEAGDDGARVLIVNGERIELGRSGDAAAAIEQALAGGRDDRVHVELELEDGDLWSDGKREAFAEAMAALASGFANDALVVALRDGASFDFDFDLDTDVDSHGREHERTARDAERMARRAQAHGRGMELFGLEAGLAGIRVGLAGLDRSLERGWAYEDGDRRTLTDQEREELEEARADLAVELEELRARLAEVRERSGAASHGVHREVRIERRDGEVRAWVDGEEATGSQLDRLLAEDEARLSGAPRAPAPPREPETPQPPRD